VLNSCNEYKESIRQTTLALEIDPTAVKALYIRSQANRLSKNFDEAVADIKAAIKLQPNDKKLRDEYKLSTDAKKAFMAKQQSAMQGMFGGGMYEDKKDMVKKSVLSKLPEFDPENSQVYFDIEIGDPASKENKKGRVTFELFTK
jgi:tetratricopeptide (TPR) repeat protein